MKKLIFLIFQILLFSNFFNAQTTSEKFKTYKFAYVDFYSFENNENGIVEYTKALDQLGKMDCFPAPCSTEEWKKREKILVDPIKKQISNLITDIENKNGLKILRLNDNFKGNSLLTINQKLNLTEKYISYHNALVNKQNVDTDFTVPKSKIGVIDTRVFFDKLNGIKSFAEFNENNNSEYICGKTKICQEIGKSIQTFAEKYEFGIILDSSKDLPSEFKDLKTIDITMEFISEYNSTK